MREYWVYILANRSRLTYIGVTNNLVVRLAQHRDAKHAFSAKYRINKLVYFESTNDIVAAISREKQLKRWVRKKKHALVETMNPDWRDLAVDWTKP
jgi:putative endonuclease